VIEQLVEQSGFVHGEHSTEEAPSLVGEYLAGTGLSEDEMERTALLGTNALHGYAVGLNERAEQVQTRVGDDDRVAWANIYHIGQAFHRSPVLKPHFDEELQTEKDTNPRFAELSSDMQEHIDVAITLYLDGTAITEIEEDIDTTERVGREMHASVKLGRIWGIPIGLHTSWFLIFGLVAWSLATGYFPDEFPDLSLPAYWVLGAVTSILLFGSVLVHELGHAYLARREGIPVNSITLFRVRRTVAG
jgi:hypothetical protein